MPERTSDHKVKTGRYQEHFEHDYQEASRGCEQDRAGDDDQEAEEDPTGSFGWGDVHRRAPETAARRCTTERFRSDRLRRLC